MILLLKIAKQNGGKDQEKKLRDWYPGNHLPYHAESEKKTNI